MTLVLPDRLARDAMGRAVTRGGHAAALTCVSIAGLVGLTMAVAGGEPRGLVAFGLALAFAGVIGLIDLRPSVTTTLVYLAVGTVIVFLAAIIVMGRSDLIADSNNALLALPRAALILVGGVGAGAGVAIAWALLGFGLGEAAVFAACSLAGGQWLPSLASTLVLLGVCAIRGFDAVARRAQRRRSTGLVRAGRMAREVGQRHEFDLRAAARLHDTVLGHLLAISAAGSGPVGERLRAGIREDLAIVIGRDWASDGSRRVAERSAAVSPVSVGADVLPEAFEAITDSRLEVRVSGDPAVLAGIAEAQRAALDSAVAQCIVNVARHARVGAVELAVGLGGGEVTVAVMDSGVGFDPDGVPADRIGLRTSIRGRVEQVGGTVRLWSTKGIGTTVVLTLPHPVDAERRA